MIASSQLDVMHMKNLRLSKKTILIIEDNLCCAMSLQLMFESAGCRVILGNNGEEGIKLLYKNQKEIDLIMLDIMMPGMTGIDFLIESKAEDILGNIPVIIQSAENHETIQLALDIGACGYINKPHEKEEISRIVRDLVKYDMQGYLDKVRLCA